MNARQVALTQRYEPVDHASRISFSGEPVSLLPYRRYQHDGGLVSLSLYTVIILTLSPLGAYDISKCA
jgi:hypothetical protein